jgi:hypothetical protein
VILVVDEPTPGAKIDRRAAGDDRDHADLRADRVRNIDADHGVIIAVLGVLGEPLESLVADRGEKTVQVDVAGWDTLGHGGPRK